MKKYVVVIEGRNFLLKSDNFKNKSGFFAKRFVEAQDHEKASSKAMDQIREELKTHVLNKKSDPPMMYVDELWEVNSFKSQPDVGKGFAFYPEENKK